MTLTNYWWLLIWLFAGKLLEYVFPRREDRLEEENGHWDYLPAILLAVPYILWAGFRSDGFGDTALYRRTYLQLVDTVSQIPGYFLGDMKDPGFAAWSVLFKTLFGSSDTLFFLVIAVFQMLCVALVFRKYSSDYWISMFLFVVSTDYLSWIHNGMRQFIAVAMIFAGFGLLVKKKYVPLVILILIAAQFHGSALLMLPVVFIVQRRAWNRWTVLMLAATMVGIVYIDRFTPILNDLLQDTQYDDLMTNGIWEEDDGANIFRVAVYSVPAILSLIGLPYVRAEDDPVINVSVNCSIVTMALYGVASVSSGIYIGRLPIYTTLMGYIALPWLIDHMFTEESAKIVKGIMIGAYLAFFYYQMHFTWGML